MRATAALGPEPRPFSIQVELQINEVIGYFSRVRALWKAVYVPETHPLIEVQHFPVSEGRVDQKCAPSHFTCGVNTCIYDGLTKAMARCFGPNIETL